VYGVGYRLRGRGIHEAGMELWSRMFRCVGIGYVRGEGVNRSGYELESYSRKRTNCSALFPSPP
jgi:hypothetical protein